MGGWVWEMEGEGRYESCDPIGLSLEGDCSRTVSRVSRNVQVSYVNSSNTYLSTGQLGPIKVIKFGISGIATPK